MINWHTRFSKSNQLFFSSKKETRWWWISYLKNDEILFHTSSSNEYTICYPCVKNLSFLSKKWYRKPYKNSQTHQCNFSHHPCTKGLISFLSVLMSLSLQGKVQKHFWKLFDSHTIKLKDKIITLRAKTKLFLFT